MSSTYAPLPFSYLKSGGNPRLGLRKEGVYGTSADIARNYPDVETRQGPLYDGPNGGDVPTRRDQPYSNPSEIRPNGLHHARNHQPEVNVSQGNKQALEASFDGWSRLQGAPVLDSRPRQEPPYDIRSTQDTTLNKPQPTSASVFDGYRKPETPYNQPPEEPNRSQPGVWRSQEPREQTRSVDRVATYYPPEVSVARGGYETPSDVEGANPKDRSQTRSPEVKPKEFDGNFILTKDPNRNDETAGIDPPSSTIPPNENHLQTLFDSVEVRKLPRYDSRQIIDATPQAQNDAASATNKSTGFDRPNYSLYYGSQNLQSAASPSRSEPTDHSSGPAFDAADLESRDSSDRALHSKDSEGEDGCCCSCRKRTAVIIAVIVTSVVCIGVGFIIGWFAANGKLVTDPLTVQSTTVDASNVSTVTTTPEPSKTNLATVATIATTTATTVTTASTVTTSQKAMTTSGRQIG